MHRLITVADSDDLAYHPVYSAMREYQDGYLVEPGKIRFWNLNRPSAATYAYYLAEPLLLSFGTAAAGAASTITLPATATGGVSVADDDYYNNEEISIIGGTGIGQTATVSDYVGSTRVVTVSSAWGTQPDNTSVYTFMCELPLCVRQAVVLRAAVNISRMDSTFEHAVQRLYGEYQQAFASALAELKVPTSMSADGPRKVEEWRE
jgi:hypothetical protein